MSTTELLMPVDRDVTSAPVCTAILEAVAEAKGVDPTDFETQLYDVVDPDAIERLFDEETDGTYRLTFAFEGRTVVVRGDGLVSVTSHREAPAGSPPQAVLSMGE